MMPMSSLLSLREDSEEREEKKHVGTLLHAFRN